MEENKNEYSEESQEEEDTGSLNEEEDSEEEESPSVEKRLQDIEENNKNLQAQWTRSQQENKKLQEENELLSKYVQFGKTGESEQSEEDETDDEPVSKRELKEQQKRSEARMEGQRVLDSFRRDNPDLQEHEDIVDSNFRRTDSKKTLDERMKDAVKATRDFLDKERKKGREEQEKETQKQEKQKRAGLTGGGGQRTSSADEKTGESYDDYIEARKKSQRQHIT
jgi:hypothetical protein